jgi:hypothetical protein
MTSDVTTPGGTGPEVMASVDHSSDGSQYVIADINREDAWLVMPHDRAPSLPDWR